MSNQLLLRVIEDNGLEADVTFAPRRDDGERSEDELIALLRAQVSSNLRRGTRLIDVSVRDEEPERAAQLAASIVNEAAKLQVERHRELAARTRDLLTTEAVRVARHLESSELASAKRSPPSRSLRKRTMTSLWIKMKSFWRSSGKH